MPLSRYIGVFEPSDLETMQRVFDAICKERHIARKDREHRDELAAEVVSRFNRGTTDEAGLLRAMSKRRTS